jgi:hypothetical protein
MENNYIFKSNGFYLGFIKNDFLYSRDGIYLGWIEKDFVWDQNGQFRGLLIEKEGHKYILTKRFTMLPAARQPRVSTAHVAPPPPLANIAPISLPVDLQDGF